MDSSVAMMFDRAFQHHQKGRVVEAEQGYREILAIDADHADSLHLLGMIAFRAGDCETAVQRIRRAIEIHPRASSYHSNLGNVLQQLGQAREAASCYLRALRIKPDLVEAQVNLANVFLAAGDTEHAVEWYQHALKLRPNLPEAQKSLGDAFRVEEKLDLARTAFESAIALKPEYADALNELGGVLRMTGDLDGALARFREAQAIEPEHPRAGFAEAMVLLLQGEFRDGWAVYERRWTCTDHATPMRAYPQPAWRGEKLDGSLLLWPEQGIGDEIMFAGSVSDVVATGNCCILECDARLLPLFARSFPEVEVISDREAGFDPARKIAAQLPTGSLPLFYRSDRAAFAAAASPYLKADPAKRKKYRDRYSDGRRVVGLAWYSNNVKTGANRSIALPAFEPLFAKHDLRWISLQYGEHAALQAEVNDLPVFVDPEADQLSDMDEFAAQVAAMDLVITIDNTTAHLAGALGIAVWLLLPFAPDWRWQASGSDSLWYPTMRIFRQPSRGDWEPVMAEVREALAAL